MDRDGEWEAPSVTVTQMVVARLQRVLPLFRGATPLVVHIVPMPEWSGALNSLLPPLVSVIFKVAITGYSLFWWD